jgi:uncharacterized membrane protein YsdA (DUF1294 family)
MTTFDRFLLAWFGLTSLLAFLLFGYDKFRAGRPGSRVPEFQLVLVGALGGWLGGLLGMLLLRHKTAKLSFQAKYAVGLLVWLGLIYVCFRQR